MLLRNRYILQAWVCLNCVHAWYPTVQTWWGWSTEGENTQPELQKTWLNARPNGMVLLLLSSAACCATSWCHRHLVHQRRSYHPTQWLPEKNLWKCMSSSFCPETGLLTAISHSNLSCHEKYEHSVVKTHKSWAQIWGNVILKWMDWEDKQNLNR